MTEEELEKEARWRAEKLEENQTLGVYDNDEDLARDEGFNDGEVYGYEEGFQDGAEFGYNKAKEELTERLTKAKVILRNVIDYLGQFCPDYPDCVIEAE